MQISNLFLKLLCGSLAFLFYWMGGTHLMDQPAKAEESTATLVEKESQEANRKILVELFLTAERKNDLEQIKKELEAASITRVRAQFFKQGKPIQNIAIGKNIPAPVARLVIRLALTYNQGIKFILPEYRYFHDHIVIGSSAYDEASLIPVTPENVEKLLDPNLTTDEFHTLYRHLTGEDVKLPKYTD